MTHLIALRRIYPMTKTSTPSYSNCNFFSSNWGSLFPRLIIHHLVEEA
jgi:hypothetical protein